MYLYSNGFFKNFVFKKLLGLLLIKTISLNLLFFSGIIKNLKTTKNLKTKVKEIPRLESIYQGESYVMQVSSFYQGESYIV